MYHKRWLPYNTTSLTMYFTWCKKIDTNKIIQQNIYDNYSFLLLSYLLSSVTACHYFYIYIYMLIVAVDRLKLALKKWRKWIFNVTIRSEIETCHSGLCTTYSEGVIAVIFLFLHNVDWDSEWTENWHLRQRQNVSRKNRRL